MSAYKNFLNKYGADKNITSGDIRAFGKAGGSRSDAQKFVSKAKSGAQGYKGEVGDNAYVAADKAKNFLNTTIKGVGVSSKSSGKGKGGKNYQTQISGSLGSGKTPAMIDEEEQAASATRQYYGDLGPDMTPAMFDQLGRETLEEIKGQQNVNYANAVGTNNVLVQQLISDSNNYAAQLGLTGTEYAADRNLDIAQYTSDSTERWKKYLADVGSESASVVQGLKNQGAIDLQAIVNTGMTDVADIQGTYASERVELQGEYDVQRANIQSDFEKFKSARAKEGQIYGSLMAGFWS